MQEHKRYGANHEHNERSFMDICGKKINCISILLYQTRMRKQNCVHKKFRFPIVRVAGVHLQEQPKGTKLRASAKNKEQGDKVRQISFPILLLLLPFCSPPPHFFPFVCSPKARSFARSPRPPYVVVNGKKTLATQAKFSVDTKL